MPVKQQLGSKCSIKQQSPTFFITEVLILKDNELDNFLLIILSFYLLSFLHFCCGWELFSEQMFQCLMLRLSILATPFVSEVIILIHSTHVTHATLKQQLLSCSKGQLLVFVQSGEENLIDLEEQVAGFCLLLHSIKTLSHTAHTVSTC